MTDTQELHAYGAESNAGAIIESTRALTIASSGFEEVAAAHLAAIIPAGYQLTQLDLEQYQEQPRRNRSKVHLGDVDSFVRYLARHAVDGSTMLYAQPRGLTVDAIIDDDKFREHRATLELERTNACVRWFGAHAAYLSQEAFAQLVEDGLGEIARPDGAELLELAQSMHATTAASFRSGLRLQDGRVQFSYVEEIDARAGSDGQLSIPATITLVFAPFEGASEMQIEARLRYRLQGGKLTLGVWLVNGEEKLREAFGSELNRIETLTNEECGFSLPPLVGNAGL